MIKNNSDFLFLFDATNCNPNGDPDQENVPRMDNETKTLLVSDVRRKRDVRDFLVNKGYDIFVRTLNDTKVTMDDMFDEIMKKYNIKDDAPSKEKVDKIIDNMIDMRIFGSAMAVKGLKKTKKKGKKDDSDSSENEDNSGAYSFTGPVQITWGYSLHPVDIIRSNTIVTIMNDVNATFGKMYKVHYALVAHSGTVNKFAAAKTRMTENDKDIFSRALVQSMMNNLTHSKQGQQPLLYLEIVYNEDFDGYLGDLRRFIRTETLKENAVRSIDDLNVDFQELTSAVNDLKSKGYIKDIYIWKDQYTKKFENLPDARELDLLKPIIK